MTGDGLLVERILPASWATSSQTRVSNFPDPCRRGVRCVSFDADETGTDWRAQVMVMQRLSEQASSGLEGPSPGDGPVAAMRAEGLWSARGRGMLAIVLALAAAALLGVGRGERSDREPLARDAPVLVLDLNSAPAEVLSALPGVGSSLIRRIVAERRARPFASTADFRRRTPGVGPATLARLAPHLRVEAPALDEPSRLARLD